MTGSIRDVEVPGIRTIERGVLTKTGPEIRREAGGPGAGAIKGTTAKIARLTEGTEKRQTKEDGEAEAEAQTAMRTREEGATEAQTPEGAEGRARPETDGVPQDQTARKAKKARGRDLAPARTVTDHPESINAEVFLLVLQYIHILNFIFSFSSGLSHIHYSVKSLQGSSKLWLKRSLDFWDQLRKCFLSALLYN